MDNFNYNEIGLKCGLEIHQQLDTKKLFCNCESVLRSDIPDFVVKRKLHAIAGETGEIDLAALYQSSLKQEFIYEGYDTTCLVELDEEPPHKINQDALQIVLQVALLLNCEILKYSQIMRKTVIDGSNTSGFQRTVLIAKDGWIETNFGKVRIDSIALEEDAARIIDKQNDKIVYRLDRLGIPLIEIATAPDIKNPEQCKEAALFIGEILRSCKVKRGIGTIRQDVNISIKKGNRIEIKGVQEPALIAKTINSEIERQLKLINKGEKIEKQVRKANPDGSTDFLRPLPGMARMYPETDLELLKISKDLINNVKKNLPTLKSEYREELRRKGLNNELIKLILDEDKVEDLKELYSVSKNINLIAKMLTLFPKELIAKRDINREDVEKILNKDVLAFILESLEKKKISEGQIKEILEKIVNGVDVVDAIKFEKENVNELEEKIVKIIKSKSGLSENAYMGLLMKEFKGKVDPRILKELIQKYIK